VSARGPVLPQRGHRKHLARAQREARLSRVVWFGLALFVVLLVGILGYGYYDLNVLQPNRAVVTVDGEAISAHQFEATTKLLQQQLLSRYNSYQQLLQIFGSDPQVQQQVQQQLSQMQLQLGNTTLMAQQVQERLIQDILVRREAEKRGITVSEEDVTTQIQNSFGYYPGGTPTPAPTPTFAPTLTLSATALASITPSPTVTAGPSPTAAPTATPRPTATPYTEAAFSQDYQTYLNDLASVNVTEDDLRAFYRAQIYGTRLREAFQADVPRVQEEVHARHILVADEATAKEVLRRYKAGESWDDLAANYSTDTSNKDNGGDLGWISRGQTVKAFEDVAFSTPVGEVSDPVQTSFGWHLIQVLGKEDRRLDDSSYQTAVSSAFDTWLQDQRDSSDIQIIGNPVDLVPTVQGAASNAQP
jgi:peptidyl-prolyl cis-trans isomerase D